MQPDGSYKLVDIRTLPFVRFEGNEAHSQRRFGLNLGGIKGFARGDDKIEDVTEGDVDGVGPDHRHPFMVRHTTLWDCHWSVHVGSPSVLIRGMTIFDGEFGFFRPFARLHRYENLEMRDLKRAGIYYPWGGPMDSTEAYEEELEPIDDQPPATVVTDLSRRGPILTVRGTTSDDGPVARVLVNGREARPLRPDFAEWEVLLDLDPDPDSREFEIRAHAEDVTGNVERLDHVLRIDPAAVPQP